VADDVSDELKIQKDLLWGMYSDVRTHARHAETLRANTVNLVLLVASALTAVITSDGHVERHELPVCLVIVAVGLAGLAFAGSYTELCHRNRLRAERLRSVLDAWFFASAEQTIAHVLAASDGSHEASRVYRWTRRLTGSTHRFWLVVPTLVIVGGALLTVIAV